MEEPEVAEKSIMMRPVRVASHNGCTEEGCRVDSDDPYLTNVIRRHYLENFGYRDLGGIVSDYADNAIMINQVNGESHRFRGKAEIKEAFRDIFELHPTGGESTFRLKEIEVHQRHGKAIWEGHTPDFDLPSSVDNFIFDDSK